MNRIERREEKWIFPFVEYSPKNKRENMPVIIQLHGAGERGEGKEDLVLVDKHGFSNVMDGENYDCIFIMPQCPKGQFWAGRVESVIKFVEQIIDEYKADKTRITLTGSSMGGFGTWMMGLTYRNFFSGIAPIAGGGMPWRCTNLVTTPVYAVHGTADETVLPLQSELMCDAVNKAGGSAKLLLLEGFGHNDGINYAYTDTDVIEWLLDQRRTDFSEVKEAISQYF